MRKMNKEEARDMYQRVFLAALQGLCAQHHTMVQDIKFSNDRKFSEDPEIYPYEKAAEDILIEASRIAGKWKNIGWQLIDEDGVLCPEEEETCI